MTRVLRKRIDFFNSEEGLQAKTQLQRMFVDATYNTPASYTANSTLYPDNMIPFVDKHMDYLSVHPQLDTHSYLANLRLRSRSKP